MKLTTAVTLLAISTASIAADTYTRGYTRKDGTYVQPHHSTAPNNTKLDNYGTQGNTNPYTGHQGTVNPYATPQPSPQPYGTPQPRRQGNPY